MGVHLQVGLFLAQTWPGYRLLAAEELVEILLAGTRGSVPAPVMGLQPLQLQTYPRGAHSAKPGEFRVMIEKLYPTCSRLELLPAAHLRRGGTPGAIKRLRRE